MTTAAHADERPHPGPKTYAKIAGLLCLITALEFGAFYTPFLQSVLVPLLVLMSAIKFALVTMFYMHLRFDHRAFTFVLLGGLVIGFGVFLTLLSLYTWSHPIGV